LVSGADPARALGGLAARSRLQRDPRLDADRGPAGIDGSRLAEQVLALALLDPLLMLAAWSAVAFAFGWRATCVALVYWGTNHPANFSWTGGAFLRDDWLAASLVALALLRRGLPAGAGALFGLAASLRAFPAAWLLGPGLAAVARSVASSASACGRPSCVSSPARSPPRPGSGWHRRCTPGATPGRASRGTFSST
jgi:hypothetical protein